MHDFDQYSRQDNYLDAYTRIIRNTDPLRTALVFNCGMGAVRTTFAMVAACIVRRKQLIERGLEDTFRPRSPAHRSGVSTVCLRYDALRHPTDVNNGHSRRATSSPTRASSRRWSKRVSNRTRIGRSCASPRFCSRVRAYLPRSSFSFIQGIVSFLSSASEELAVRD